MKILVIFLASLAFALSGCTKKPSCETTTKYSKVVGDGVAELFDCKKPERIAMDLQDEIEKLKLCENRPTGLISVIVCKPVASFVTKQVVRHALPKKWECSGGIPGTALEAAIYNACVTLPF